jgi:hypothetical protein
MRPNHTKKLAGVFHFGGSFGQLSLDAAASSDNCPKLKYTRYMLVAGKSCAFNVK